MDYRKLGNSDIKVPPMSLGTWVFGGDHWWGKQADRDSVEVMEAAIRSGINTFDTAPIYGRGRSEKIIGDFIRKRKIREKIVLATKLGLEWQGSKILHNLTKKRMLKELDDSRQRLSTDYFDLYQVHWPDPATPIAQTAELMHSFFQKGTIKAIGVSNYSLEQLREFMKYSPLHSLQPQYSCFERGIEEEIIPFCIQNNVSIITYAPLYSGILTGKFFFEGIKVPNDTNRDLKKKDLEEPGCSINKEALSRLKDIAANYQKTLAQLVINWNFSQNGITSTIVGTRNLSQFKDNLGACNWQISRDDMDKIDKILKERLTRINKLK